MTTALEGRFRKLLYPEATLSTNDFTLLDLGVPWFIVRPVVSLLSRADDLVKTIVAASPVDPRYITVEEVGYGQLPERLRYEYINNHSDAEQSPLLEMYGAIRALGTDPVRLHTCVFVMIGHLHMDRVIVLPFEKT